MSDGPSDRPSDEPRPEPGAAGEDAGRGHGHGHDPIGSAAEEAVRLLGALGDWARDHTESWAQPRGVEDHLATGAPECTYCPICRTVHVIREAGPDVRLHLASAAASLLQAAASVLHAAATPPRPPSRDAGVQHIDLDDADAGAYDENGPVTGDDPGPWEES